MSSSSVRLHVRRGENAAMLGLVAQAAAALILLVVSLFHPAAVYGLLAAQCGIGIPFWLMGWMHLRARRLAREEARDLEVAERQRREKGLASLFEEGDQPQSARNLAHLERFFAPAASLVVGLLLLLPIGLRLLTWLTGGAAPFVSLFRATGEGLPYPYMYSVLAILLGAGLFLLGMYGAGLLKVREWEPLRAGAGYALTTTGGAVLAGLAMLVSGMFGVVPERVVAGLILLWMTLQGIEILINVVLDLYRPRVAGVPTRPAYDSRLSGLLAEPKGIFETFAHTLDYQFGFRISESWFFRFLRRAIVPLVVIQFAFLYLLSSFVYVQPGDVAIIERWGAPRGLAVVTTGADRWEALAQSDVGRPLSPGLWVKYPWPIERAIHVPRDRISTLTIGYAFDTEDVAREKAAELRGIVANWDREHIKDETAYLMPLPSEMTADGSEPAGTVDALFLSGTFTVEYRIGSDADVFRYQYTYQDATRMLRVMAEREVTAFLAGADFWAMMARTPDRVRGELAERIRTAARELGIGIEIVNVGIANVHPPAGRVGGAFLQVIASRQERMIRIHRGETGRVQILGMTPSQTDEVLREAEAYAFQREVLAEAESDWFRDQMRANAAAPAVYRELMRLQAMEEGVRGARLILLPAETTLLLDESEAMKPEGLMRSLGREVERNLREIQ